MNLIEIKEDSFWSKIKKFFRGIFYKRSSNVNVGTISENIEKKVESETDIKIKSGFNSNMNFMQNHDKELRDLQAKYRSGEIKESDLNKEQIKELNDLYDKQIKELRASNEVRKQRLKRYREKMAIQS